MKNAISLIDGRNAQETDELRAYFSEEALIFYRTEVEVEWLRFMAQDKNFPLRGLTVAENSFLTALLKNFGEKDAERVKEIEKTTNHDLKAVELYLREKLSETSLIDTIEWLHFACTSEDINNLAWAEMLKGATERVLLPQMRKIESRLKAFAKRWKGVSMLARTHGQPATPTTVGKELLVFALRLERQIKKLAHQEFLGKFAGATGNFAAHKVAFPAVDWLTVSQKFVESRGLFWNPVVTQIEPHDFVAELAHGIFRANTVLIDLARDVWGMIAFGFFKQKTVAGEVGSSTMPHKVNPIDFENAEGNFGVANALFDHFATKLPLSRFQRDLTDSTVFRSLGTAFGHTLLALKKLEKGLEKLEINEEALAADLDANPEVLAEAVQTVMRKNGIQNPYDKLKALTRGKKMSLASFREFVADLELPAADKAELMALTPANYTGLSEKIVDIFGK